MPNHHLAHSEDPARRLDYINNMYRMVVLLRAILEERERRAR